MSGPDGRAERRAARLRARLAAKTGTCPAPDLVPPVEPPVETLEPPPRDRIAQLAYERWLSTGCRVGCDVDDWLWAEAQVCGGGDGAPGTSR